MRADKQKDIGELLAQVRQFAAKFKKDLTL